jgi:protein SERAC1
VFIHGLGGDIEKTWCLRKGAFWPLWISEDFADCQVFVAGYDSSKFASILKGSGASIQDIATMIADDLISRHVRSPNLLIICHSLGGLIAKRILRKCEDSLDSDFTELGRSIKGMVFLGTPHQGAKVATAIDAVLRDFTSQQAKQLLYAEDALLDLNSHFRNTANRKGLVVKSFYETKDTWGIRVVDQVTADPGVLGSEPIAVEANHTNICKPENKESRVYRSVSTTIRKVLSQTGQATGGGGSSTGDVVSSKEKVHGNSVPLADCSQVILSDYEYFTTVAAEDRRDLKTKLEDAHREYLVRDARRKKERFASELRSRLAQPAAITRYTKLMSDVESRFNRHVTRVIAESGDHKAIDDEIQDNVIAPCVKAHSTQDHEITANHVDEVLYYLAGNCHLAWDND